MILSHYEALMQRRMSQINVRSVKLNNSEQI